MVESNNEVSRLAYAEGIVCLATAKRGKGQQAMLHFMNICVQTKAKVRLLSAHKVYECAPLLYRRNVGVAYG